MLALRLPIRYGGNGGGSYYWARWREFPRDFEAVSAEFSLPVRIQARGHSVPACLSNGTERPARLNIADLLRKKVVGASGFEPPTPRSRTDAHSTESFEKSSTLRESIRPAYDVPNHYHGPWRTITASTQSSENCATHPAFQRLRAAGTPMPCWASDDCIRAGLWTRRRCAPIAPKANRIIHRSPHWTISATG